MFFVLSRLAWRYLWRNHRRTVVMLSAIAVGTWAMIFMTALTRGMVDQMIVDGISVIPGHVQIHDPDYLDDPSVYNRVALSDTELTARFHDAGFVAWASRVRVPAVVTSERESRGVTLLGIDPQAERSFSFVDYDAVEGRFLDGADDKGVVLGAKLADTLETRVGKRVVLMSQDPDNEIADRGFRVVGLFHAEIEVTEESYAFIGKRTAQDMLRIGDTVTEVVFVGDDYRDVEPLVANVMGRVDDSVQVSRWTEVDTYLGTMMGMMDGFMLIWVIVIFLALSFGLVNTLVMAVFERIREIGLMLALGMKPASVLGQIIIESMMLLAVGLYPNLSIDDVILANMVVMILGFLASLSPAWRASRYEPVEAITKV
jgi:ABC-type lipoprotein release transport system permease subunit